MGNITPTITQLLHEQEKKLSPFRRALYREEQLILDDLFANAHHHRAALAHTAHLSPLEAILLAMLVEEHKRVLQIERRLGKI
jgi:hypothetical protein